MEKRHTCGREGEILRALNVNVNGASDITLPLAKDCDIDASE